MKNLQGAFRSVSPAIALVYAILAIACVMVSLNPAVIAIAYLATMILSFSIVGYRQTLKRLSWQFLIVLIFAIINCLFAGRGITAFLEVGPFVLHVESFVYGALMGLMVMSALNYFMLLVEVVSSDEALSLLGNKAPTTSLVTSMSLSMIPKLRKQERELRAIEGACTCAKPTASKTRYSNPAMYLTHLLSTSLEDSLVRSDSMRARGWGLSSKRSAYKKRRMTPKEKFALVLIVLLGGASVVIAYVSASCFQIYPQIAFAFPLQTYWGFMEAPQMFCIGFLVCLVYFFLPHVFLMIEAVKWKQ